MDDFRERAQLAALLAHVRNGESIAGSIHSSYNNTLRPKNQIKSVRKAGSCAQR
jgi:hypothetical protein